MSGDDRDDPPSKPSPDHEGADGRTYAPDDLVKSTEAARILGISVHKLRHRVDRGLVPVDHTVKRDGYRNGHKMFRVRDLRRIRFREQRQVRRSMKRRAEAMGLPPHASEVEGMVYADVFQLLKQEVSEPDIVIRLQLPPKLVRQIAKQYRDALRPPEDEVVMGETNAALSLRGYEQLASAEPHALYRVIQTVLKDVDDYRHRLHDVLQALSSATASVPERVAALERETSEAKEDAASARAQLEAKQIELNRAEVAVGALTELNRRLVDQVCRLRGEDREGPSPAEQAEAFRRDAACSDDGDGEED